MLGYENFGYWDFLVQPGTPQVIRDHLESMFSLGHTADPVEVLTSFAPLGKLESWLREDRRSASNMTLTTREVRAIISVSGRSFLTSELTQEKEHYLKAFSLPGALEGSLAWYRVVVSGIEAKDSEGD